MDVNLRGLFMKRILIFLLITLIALTSLSAKSYVGLSLSPYFEFGSGAWTGKSGDDNWAHNEESFAFARLDDVRHYAVFFPALRRNGFRITVSFAHCEGIVLCSLLVSQYAKLILFRKVNLRIFFLLKIDRKVLSLHRAKGNLRNSHRGNKQYLP